MKAIYTKKTNKLLGYVDRSGDNSDPDYHVLVELPCGFKAKFWLLKISDREYLRRTRFFKKRETALRQLFT